MIGRGRGSNIGVVLSDVATSRGRGALGLTSVLNGGNVSGQVVGVVGDSLDPAVGKVDGVRSSYGTSAIVGLRLLKVGLGVVVGHGVSVGVGGGLGGVGGGNGVHHGGVLGGGGGSGHMGKGDDGLEKIQIQYTDIHRISKDPPLFLAPTVDCVTN